MTAQPDRLPGRRAAEFRPTEQLDQSTHAPDHTSDPQDEHIEEAIVGHDPESGADQARDQLAAVGHEHQTSLNLETFAVQLKLVGHRAELAQLAGGRSPIGQTPQAVLAGRTRGPDDAGVPADTGGHREEAGGAGDGDGAVRRDLVAPRCVLPVERDTPQVDRPDERLTQRLKGAVRIVRNPQGVSQHVARTGRDDRDRNPRIGQVNGHRRGSSVAAHHDDQSGTGSNGFRSSRIGRCRIDRSQDHGWLASRLAGPGIEVSQHRRSPDRIAQARGARIDDGHDRPVERTETSRYGRHGRTATRTARSLPGSSGARS